MTLQHLVLFRFPSDLSHDDEAAMLSQVRAWPTEIGLFRDLRLGRSLDPAQSKGFQYCLCMEVADEETLRRYREHPTHQLFVAWLDQHGAERIAFDYLLEPGARIYSEASTD
jgi:Stress responsive A/B Barrel Domain